MDANRSAPAFANAEMFIAAPPDDVWEVLADIPSWPDWNPDVKSVQLDGPLAPGTVFRWKAGGLPIESTIEEVVPNRRIVWTGKAPPGIRAVHVWTFEPEGQGTRVRTEESFEGWLVRLLSGPMTRMLDKSLKLGLEALRAEAETEDGRRGKKR